MNETLKILESVNRSVPEVFGEDYDKYLRHMARFIGCSWIYQMHLYSRDKEHKEILAPHGQVVNGVVQSVKEKGLQSKYRSALVDLDGAEINVSKNSEIVQDMIKTGHLREAKIPDGMYIEENEVDILESEDAYKGLLTINTNSLEEVNRLLGIISDMGKVCSVSIAEKSEDTLNTEAIKSKLKEAIMNYAETIESLNVGVVIKGSTSEMLFESVTYIICYTLGIDIAMDSNCKKWLFLEDNRDNEIYKMTSMLKAIQEISSNIIKQIYKVYNIYAKDDCGFNIQGDKKLLSDLADIVISKTLTDIGIDYKLKIGSDINRGKIRSKK